MKSFVLKCFIVFIAGIMAYLFIGGITYKGDKSYTLVNVDVIYRLDRKQESLNGLTLTQVFEKNFDVSDIPQETLDFWESVYNNLTLND